VILNDETADRLWSGELCIGFIVHMGKIRWLIDVKDNFSLNAEIDYRAYLEKKIISESQYEAACRAFRGGILNLTSDNFLEYLGPRIGHVYSKPDLMGFMFRGTHDPVSILDKVESSLVTGGGLADSESRRAQIMASRLPLFYINFDRKMYMYLEKNRFHEKSAGVEWFAQYGDFLALIPDSERYWIFGGRDYWKCR